LLCRNTVHKLVFYKLKYWQGLDLVSHCKISNIYLKIPTRLCYWMRRVKMQSTEKLLYVDIVANILMDYWNIIQWIDMKPILICM